MRTRADACNVAIKQTQSEFVFFTDDDVIVPKIDFEFNSVAYRSDVAAVGGPNFALRESTFWQRVIE